MQSILNQSSQEDIYKTMNFDKKHKEDTSESPTCTTISDAALV